MLGEIRISRRLTALIAAIFASLVLLPATASATVGAQTTYVAGVGGVDYASASNSNSCSAESTPCATLAGALAQTASAGTVEVSGTVTESSPASVDQDVTIEANPDGTSAELVGEASDDDGLLNVSANTVTISGITFAGNGNDGGPNSEITAATAGDLIVTDSTFAKGITDVSGGAISFSGTGDLSVTDSTFHNNVSESGGSGGAIDYAASGTASVTDSTFNQNSSDGDGGAIDNGSGTLSVTDSTFTENSGDIGGAISNDDRGTLDVSGSTFSANDANGANGYGGAISNGDKGNGVATVTWSTFLRNAAGSDGGAIDNGDEHTGMLTVTDSTFSGNADASGYTIDNGATGTGTVYVAADLFDGTCDAATGTWHDYGDNAASSSGCIGGSANGVNGDAVDSAVHTDLGSLASNGGPTQTILPLTGDPAIDLLADNSSFTVPTGSGSSVTVGCPVAADQRGFPNAGTSGCDAGSVQTGGAATVYVAGSGGVDVGAAGDGNDCAVESTPCATLAGALGETASGGTVELSGTLNESLGTSVDQDVTIEANPDGSSATLDGTGGGAGMLFLGDDTVAINGLAFEHGFNNGGGGDGGAIANYDGGTLSVTDSSFIDDHADIGGAIVNLDGNLTVTGSTFADAAADSGGAIYNSGSGSTLTVTSSTFTGNTAASDGGAIDNDDGSQGEATVTDSTFAGNTAIDGGTIDNGDNGGAGDIYLAADVLDGTCDQAGGSWNDKGYNAATSSSCLGSTPPATDALVSTAAGDLGPLQNNGGLTETMQLLSGNPAINLIPSGSSLTVDDGISNPTVACPVTADQRGVGNLGSTGCDAGAIQYATQAISFGASPTSVVVGQSGSTVTASSSAGLGVGLALDASTTNSACTLTGSTVSFSHAGSCVLDASQAGDVNIAASGAQQTITVNAAQTSTSVSASSSAVTATVIAVAPGGGTPSGTVDFTVGSQTIGTANLVDGKATLTYSVPQNTTQTVTASFQGSDDYDGSSASAGDSGPTVVTPATTPITPAVVVNPRITATLPSARRRTANGWWTSAVTVKFKCTTNGSPLDSGCPAAVTLKSSGRGQRLTRKITAKNGGTASITLSGINIDLTTPKVGIAGPNSRASYLFKPVSARCMAHDGVSGIRSCTLTRHVRASAVGEAVTYTATATSNAGTIGHASTTIEVRTIGLIGAPISAGRYEVRPGASYTLEVLARNEPSYLDAAVSPLPPDGIHQYFQAIGKVGGLTLWKLRVTIEQGLSLYKQWTIGVLTGRAVHLLKLET